MSNRDDNRMKFLALKLRASIPLTTEEQAEWNRHHHLGDKIKAGLPLTPEEQEKLERAKEARYTVTTDNVLIVEAPPMTVDDWKRKVAEQRGKGSGFGIAPEKTTGGAS